jgi:hypothetical protein
MENQQTWVSVGKSFKKKAAEKPKHDEKQIVAVDV